MNQYAILTGYKKVGKKRVPVFDTEYADGFKIEDGCLFFFNLDNGSEDIVKAYAVGGWLEVEESADE